MIPYSHSARLFHTLRNHSLAALRRDSVSNLDLPISESEYKGWGVVRNFSLTPSGDRIQREVVWWEGLAGGHNSLGYTEGVMDLIRRVAKL